MPMPDPLPDSAHDHPQDPPPADGLQAPERAPAGPLKLLRAMAFGVLCGVAGGLALVTLRRTGVFDLDRWFDLPALTGWDLLGLAVSALLAVLLHEVGHLVGGLRGGMRLLMFAVGPLRVTRNASGLGVSRQSLRHGLLGFVSMLPDPARPFVPQFRRLAVGGPLASLLLVLAAAALAVPLTGRGEFHVLAFGVFSAIVLLMTAIPMRLGGIETDGAQLQDLARGGVGTQVKALVLGLAGQSITGVRPRDLDAALIAQGLALAERDDGLDPAMAGYPHLLAALQADDRGDPATRDRHMVAVARHARRMPPATRAQFAVELAYHAARTGDAAAARRWLDHAGGAIGEPGDRLRAEAAIAAVEGRMDAARTALRQARERLPHSLDPGGALWHAEQLDLIEARLAADA